MAEEAEVIYLELPAKEEYIVIVRLVTSLIAKRIGFSDDKETDIKFAIGEGCINAIHHAYKNCHKRIQRMQIRYLCYTEKLVIVVKDFGQGFDPYFVQDYIRSKDIETLQGGGLGMFVIKSMMDEVEYDSSISTGTQLRMKKYK